MDFRFRLGLLVAAAALLAAGPAAAQEKAAAPAGVTPAAIAQGDSIFHTKGLCYACHGTDAKGTVGPNLTDAEWLHGDGSLRFHRGDGDLGHSGGEGQEGRPHAPQGRELHHRGRGEGRGGLRLLPQSQVAHAIGPSVTDGPSRRRNFTA